MATEAIFLVPRILGTTSVIVNIISAHDDYFTTINATWSGVDEEYDVYIASIDLPSGLFLYDLTLDTIFGEIYGNKNGTNLIFNKSRESDKFQLTISDFKYPAPSDFLGGIIYHIFVDRFAIHGTPYAKPGTIIADYSAGMPEYPAYPYQQSQPVQAHDRNHRK